ncbi:MAG: transglycosylase SLT domain-containing protein [Spirochaetales bacterium]|nr:transglycosylase SLT domain-containing protein [Spirochaetales bacterium]
MIFFSLFRLVPFFLVTPEESQTVQNRDNRVEENYIVELESNTTSVAPVETAGSQNMLVDAALLENVPDNIELLLIKYSVQYGLPLDVVVRLSEVESNHGEYIRSAQDNYDGSFDIGVLALNSNFIEYFGERYFEGDSSLFDPYNPEHNIQTGLAYLAHLNALTEGDLTSAVAAYNCGYRSMKRGEIPSSTQRYVKAIIHGERL